MKALILNINNGWDKETGFELADVPKPVLENDKEVIIKVHYTGVCGTDKGLWYRQAFRDQVMESVGAENTSPNPSLERRGIPLLKKERTGEVKSYRIVGHEIFGEVYELSDKTAKKFHLKKGDFVTCESHLVCNECPQCLAGQKNVCTNEKILGISHDGGFAEFIKVPGHIAWKTDTDKIRPEVAVLQEPFGNAVHCASKVKLQGKTVLISGLGPIGLFLATIAKAQGAKLIIGIDPNPVSREMAEKLGIDYVLATQHHHHPPTSPNPSFVRRGINHEVEEKNNISSSRGGGKGRGEANWKHDPMLVGEIMKATSGQGVDVSFEMAGFNNSLNNCIFSTRRGGEVVLFGIKSADFTIEDYNRLIIRGLTLHAVIGRQVWDTWEATKKHLENKSNKIQEKLYNIILNRGQDTILPISDFTKDRFVEMMSKHPKFLVQF